MAAPSGSVHELKTWPDFFTAVRKGIKTFEVRENDRDFKVGDALVLCEFIPCNRCHGTGRERLDAWDSAACGCGKPYGKFTGKKLRVRVTYMTDFQQQENHVVMAIALNADLRHSGSAASQPKETTDEK